MSEEIGQIRWEIPLRDGFFGVCVFSSCVAGDKTGTDRKSTDTRS